jgi:hypothetical protein
MYIVYEKRIPEGTEKRIPEGISEDMRSCMNSRGNGETRWSESETRGTEAVVVNSLIVIL